MVIHVWSLVGHPDLCRHDVSHSEPGRLCAVDLPSIQLIHASTSTKDQIGIVRSRPDDLIVPSDISVVIVIFILVAVIIPVVTASVVPSSAIVQPKA